MKKTLTFFLTILLSNSFAQNNFNAPYVPVGPPNGFWAATSQLIYAESPSGKKFFVGGCPASANGGLYYYNGAAWSMYNYFTNSDIFNTATEALLDSLDNLWIATDTGLWKFDGGIFTKLNTGNSSIPGNKVLAMCKDDSGNIWTVCSNTTYGTSPIPIYLARYDGSSFTTYGPFVTLPAAITGMGYDDKLFIVISDQNNIVIKVMTQGFFIFDGTNFTAVNTSNSNLSSNSTQSMGIDNNGNIWTGLNIFGFAKYNGTSWVTYPAPDTVYTGGSSIHGFEMDKTTNTIITYGNDMVSFHIKVFHNLNFNFFDRYEFNPFGFGSGVFSANYIPLTKSLFIFNNGGPGISSGQNPVLFNESGFLTVGGFAFDDINANGVFDAGETKLPSVNVRASTVGNIAGGLTDSSGEYHIAVNDSFASYNLEMFPYQYWVNSNSPATYTIVPGTDSLCCYPFATHADPGHIDVRANIFSYSTSFRRNSINPFAIIYKNKGTATVSDSVTMTFDPLFSFDSSVPPPDNTTPISATWYYSNLIPGETRNINVQLFLSQSANLGDSISCYAAIKPLATDEYIPDNYDSLKRIIIGSFDPNAKEVFPAGDITTTEISSGNFWMQYQIHFQNTGTDTAFSVIINDTISSNLDLSSFECLGSSHSVTYELKSPRLIRFYFNNILLPDSNVDEPASKGFVSFRIKPNSILQPGDQITNKAFIYFDANPAVITNDVITIVVNPNSIEEFGSQSNFSVIPNSTKDFVTIHYNLPSSQQTTISLFNLFGQKIKNLYEGKQPAGTHELKADLKDLAAGIYLIDLTRNGEWMVKKIMKE